jgi:general stress protein 26
MEHTSREHEPANSPSHVAELARKFDTAFLVTHGQRGGLHARPMGIVDVENDAKLWFATRADSLKLDELRADPEVLVLMQDGRKRSLSVNGKARALRDDARAKRLWTPALSLWFSGPDDPALVLLEVEPSSAEYWDASGKAGARLALTALRRYLSGEELRPGDTEHTHERVTLTG